MPGPRSQVDSFHCLATMTHDSNASRTNLCFAQENTESNCFSSWHTVCIPVFARLHVQTKPSSACTSAISRDNDMAHMGPPGPPGFLFVSSFSPPVRCAMRLEALPALSPLNRRRRCKKAWNVVPPNNDRLVRRNHFARPPLPKI